MKYLFVITAALLLLAGFGTWLSFPDSASEVPVIYWVTDPNPARELQVEGFHEWLIERGHVGEDGKPLVELKLDVSNADVSKKVIQSVSGVGGELMDLSGGEGLQLFKAMGVVADITEEAEQLGFASSATYPAVESEITVDGRQFMFPCNVYATQYWYNKATFEAHGQPLPPDRWTLEEFEQRGKAFVEAANEGRRPGDRVFFVNVVDPQQVYRSLGLSTYNQTMTACDLDDPRYARTLTMIRKWRDEDRIIPSPDDVQSFDAAAGYGGLGPQLFARGNYAMMPSGRYMLIQFRRFGDLELGVTEPPHGGFPVTRIGTRAAAVYAGGAHPELASLFLAYLASEDYSMQIVHDADALPPNPAVTQTEAFLRPPDHPNEWGVHEKFARAINDIGIGGAYSRFILSSVVDRELTWFRDQFDEGHISAELAARQTADSVNRLIADNVRRNPALQAPFEKALALQRQIDERLESGQPIPRSWISNPFYLRYYEAQGMLEEDGPASADKEIAIDQEGASI